MTSWPAIVRFAKPGDLVNRAGRGSIAASGGSCLRVSCSWPSKLGALRPRPKSVCGRELAPPAKSTLAHPVMPYVERPLPRRPDIRRFPPSHVKPARQRQWLGGSDRSSITPRSLRCWGGFGVYRRGRIAAHRTFWRSSHRRGGGNVACRGRSLQMLGGLRVESLLLRPLPWRKRLQRRRGPRGRLRRYAARRRWTVAHRRAAPMGIPCAASTARLYPVERHGVNHLSVTSTVCRSRPADRRRVWRGRSGGIADRRGRADSAARVIACAPAESSQIARRLSQSTSPISHVVPPVSQRDACGRPAGTTILPRSDVSRFAATLRQSGAGDRLLRHAIRRSRLRASGTCLDEKPLGGGAGCQAYALDAFEPLAGRCLLA